MRKKAQIARTAKHADDRGHEKVAKRVTAAQRAKGAHFAAEGAKPGDVAWVGPCQGGTRIVCYYNSDMQPSDCRNQSC